MAQEKFSKSEALKFGWETFRMNPWFFVLITLAVVIIQVVPDQTEKLLKNQYPLLALLISLISVVVNMSITMGMIKINLIFCDDQQAKFSDLFSCFGLFFKYFAASIVYLLIMAGGLILLIVPGIIWMIKFGFYGYIIVDEGLGPIAALKKSAAITKGAKKDLFVFGLLSILVTILGIIALFVGVFVSIPVVGLAWAYVYRALLKQNQDISQPILEKK